MRKCGLCILLFAVVISQGCHYSYQFYNRGLEKYHLGDFEGAIEDFTRAVELDPIKSDKALEEIKFCESKIKRQVINKMKSY